MRPRKKQQCAARCGAAAKSTEKNARDVPSFSVWKIRALTEGATADPNFPIEVRSTSLCASFELHLFLPLCSLGGRLYGAGRGARSVVCSSWRFGGSYLQDPFDWKQWPLSKERPARAKFSLPRAFSNHDFGDFGFTLLSPTKASPCQLLIVADQSEGRTTSSLLAQSVSSLSFLVSAQVLRSPVSYWPAHTYPAPANPFLYAPWRTSSHLSENCTLRSRTEEATEHQHSSGILCASHPIYIRFRSLQPVSYTVHISNIF